MSEKKEFTFYVGNEQDLKDFKQHFSGHDKNTLDRYFRVSTKKEKLMLIRRSRFKKMNMQIILIPYASSKTEFDILSAIKKRVPSNDGFLRALPVECENIYIFGIHLPKNETDIFVKPYEKRKKKLPQQ